MEVIFAQLQGAALDIILLVVAIVVNLFLAVAVYRSDPGSATNRIFALLTVATIFWLAVITIVRIPGLVEEPIYLHRLAIFFAAPMSLLFFLLAHTLPSPTLLLGRGFFRASIAGTALMMALNISPYAFIADRAVDGTSVLVPGVGLIPFAVLSSVFSILAVYFLIKKYRLATGVAKNQLRLVLEGMFTMLVLVISTILLPIILFNSLFFLPFASLYTLAFLGATAYAITEYQLFNVKILLTQVLTVTICIILFGKIFGEESGSARLTDIVILIFTVIFGYFLVRSVKREVEQRELIQKQELELEAVNKQQEGLLHFISHEIKGYLTKNEAEFAAITEGDYGTVSESLKTLATSALQDTRKGVETVMDILDASNMKKGTVAYDKKQFDFSAAVQDVVNSLKPMAQEKGISLEYASRADGAATVNGDENKLRHHVIRNLIDNSIRYTPSGNVKVELTKNGPSTGADSRPIGPMLRMTVADTGVGISSDDMKRLFTEGGKGADSIKVNVHSTGYGLYIAKSIVEAHGGKIWAESEGKGKGSRFFVELPAA